MSMKYKLAAALTLLASMSLIVACSSSSSSSGGSGQIPTGQYTGNLNGQVRSNTTTAVPTSTRIILNVVAQLDTSTSPSTITGISGNMVVTGGDRCWSGGTINGSGTGGTSNTDTSNTDTSNTDTSNTDTSTTDTSSSPGPDQPNPEAFKVLKDSTKFVFNVFITPAQAQSVINGDQMVLDITTAQGTLNMIGRVTDDSYSGTFTSDDSACGPIAGGFDLDRV